MRPRIAARMLLESVSKSDSNAMRHHSSVTKQHHQDSVVTSGDIIERLKRSFRRFLKYV